MSSGIMKKRNKGRWAYKGLISNGRGWEKVSQVTIGTCSWAWRVTVDVGSVVWNVRGKKWCINSSKAILGRWVLCECSVHSIKGRLLLYSIIVRPSNRITEGDQQLSNSQKTWHPYTGHDITYTITLPPITQEENRP